MFTNLDLNIVTTNYTYVRNNNHLVEPLEAKLADLTGAKRVILANSGMDAITTMFDLFKPKSVAIDINSYYETRQWLDYNPQKCGVIPLDFHQLKDIETLAFGANVPMFYLDNPNVFGEFYDIEAIANIVHQKGGKLVVDNSFLSLYYLKPLQMGADIVVESLSKYVCGHGDVLSGYIALNEKSENDLNTHLESIIEGVPDGRDINIDWILGKRGRYISPMTIFLIERGLETLDLRIRKHTENAQIINNILIANNIKCLYSGYGGVLILPEQDSSLCDKFKVFKKLPTFGTTYSTTNFIRCSDSYKGVGQYIRLSCGLEDVKLLIEDLKQALNIHLKRF